MGRLKLELSTLEASRPNSIDVRGVWESGAFEIVVAILGEHLKV